MVADWGQRGLLNVRCVDSQGIAENAGQLDMRVPQKDALPSNIWGTGDTPRGGGRRGARTAGRCHARGVGARGQRRAWGFVGGRVSWLRFTAPGASPPGTATRDCVGLVAASPTVAPPKRALDVGSSGRRRSFLGCGQGREPHGTCRRPSRTGHWAACSPTPTGGRALRGSWVESDSCRPSRRIRRRRGRGRSRGLELSSRG